MPTRYNHYELAVEAYFQAQGIRFVSVDDTRRAILAGVSLKSMDFIVERDEHDLLLVEVKGRKYPTTEKGGRWENWVTEEDVNSLLEWEGVFGADYRGLFIFAYDVAPTHCEDFENLFEFEGRQYGLYSILAGDYQVVMTPRSPRWQTVSIARAPFAALRSPLDDLLAPPVTTPNAKRA